MTGEGGLPGFTYVVAREDVSDDGLEITLEAGAEARSLLAERFGLLALEELNARLIIEPWRKKGLKVVGTFNADLAQSCIVTLDPVPAKLNADFTLLYLPEDVSGRRAMEVAVDPLAEEPPDPLPPEGIDLGEAVAEQLALVLDPYPRADGAELAVAESLESRSEKKPNPFEILKNLKTQD
ncbi:DUF177 domain-containing protein [Parvibaculaceae bacterium PLY_AMNH_Bact1]|nr:DUF177 domain-containing protein [Parvibaculaceae bacterium PLY_AMNH_Bact1]